MTESPTDRPSSKMVRCERHGLFYNPETADGCPVCRTAEECEAGGLPFSPAKAAIGIGLVAVIFFAGGRIMRGLADTGAASQAAVEEEARDAILR